MVFLGLLDLNVADYGVKMKKLPVKNLPQVLHNHLSAPALLNQVRRDFEQVHDPRRYGQQFSLADLLMSGLAVFRGCLSNFSKTPGDPLPNGSDPWYSIAP